MSMVSKARNYRLMYCPLLGRQNYDIGDSERSSNIAKTDFC